MIYRRLTKAPGVRHLRRLPVAERAMRGAREARAVRGSVRFVARELAGRGVSSYRLRDAAGSVVIRHGTGDPWVLGEIFVWRVYEPPPSVAEVLGTRPRILDLGGHIGLFGVFIRSRYPGASILSLEPDPLNARMLRECIRLNRASEHWHILEAAASTSDGEIPFAVGLGELSREVTDPGAARVMAVAHLDGFGYAVQEIDHEPDSGLVWAWKQALSA